MEVAMRISLTDNCTAPGLRSVARRSKHAGQARRLMALAALYDGATRTEAAAMAGVTVQIIRDWVLKLNAHGPDGLIDRHDDGKTPHSLRRTSVGVGNSDRGRADPSDPRRRALAGDRPVPVVVGRL